MVTNWPQYRLDEVTELIVDCPHSTPKWTDEGVVVLRNQYIRDGRLDLSAPSYTTEEGYADRIKRAVPTAGDLVLTREAPMGEVCQIPEDLKCCLGQRMVLIRANREVVDPKYLLFVLQSPYLKHQISWNEGTGTTVSNIRIPNIKAFNIPMPSLDEQKSIAHILGTLDDKIELNRQMNATLEAMAQALFKSWFVDFDPVIDNALAAGNPIPEPLQKRAEARAALVAQRKPIPTHKEVQVSREAGCRELPEAIQKQFPSSFVFNEEMGWIPEGWEVQSLDSIVDLIGGGTPKTSIDEYWGGEVPWFSVVDAPNPSDVFVLNTEKSITRKGLENSSAKLLPKGTTIISARGTVGKCAVVVQPMAINQSCYAIRGKDGFPDYYVYYTILLRVSDLQQRGHGSVFNTITRDTFRSINTCVGSSELLRSFDQTVSPYMDRIVSNIEQTSILSQSHDALLPKLLSGEMALQEMETGAAQ